MANSSIWLPKGEQGDPGVQGPPGIQGPPGPQGGPGPDAEAFTQFLAALANASDPAKGAALVGYSGRTVGAKLTDVMTVLDKGADPTGMTSSNAAFLAVHNAGKTIWVPPGTYQLEDFPLLSGMSIYLDERAVLTVPPGRSGRSFLFVANKGATGTPIEANNVRRIRIFGGTLQGRVTTEGFSEQCHLISISGVSDVLIQGATIKGFKGDGVYIGSGDTDTAGETHNYDVTIKGCIFDGENRDNRQGVSIIDGTNVLVDTCLFKNSTRVDMPGALDIEPQSSYNRVSNVEFRNCFAYGIGGTSGVFSYNNSNLGIVQKPNGIRFTNCHAWDCTNAGGLYTAQTQGQAADATTAPLDMVIRNCSGTRLVRPNVTVGCRKITEIDCVYTDCDKSAFFGLKTSGSNFQVEILDNTYTRVGKNNLNNANSGMDISTNSRMRVRSKFIDCGRADGAGGFGIRFIDGITDHVDLSNTVIETITGVTTYGISKLSTHTLNTMTNRGENLFVDVVGNDFKAKPANQYSYTSSATADTLPLGISISAYNADAGAPGPIKRGQYVTCIIIDPVDGSIASTSYQEARPGVSNGTPTDNDAFYIRKPSPTVAGWGPWVRK